MKNLKTLRKSLALGALAACLAVPAAAVAMGGPHHDPLARLEKQVEALGLDAQTAAAVRTTIDAARNEAKTSRPEIRAAHQAMRDLLRQDSPDASAVLAQADTIGALMTAERKRVLQATLDVRALLTPDQRAALMASMERRGGERGERGARRDR